MQEPMLATAGEVYPGFTLGTGPGPLTAIISLDATGWQVSIHGEGVEIEKSGTYASCPNPSNGQCISLSDIMSYPGVNGTLRAVGGAGRENQTGELESVLVISN